MKKSFLAILLLIMAAALNAQNFEDDKAVNNVKATVKVLDDGETVVLVPIDNAGTRYVSQQMPAEYKKDGLQVTYSGVIGKIPPNVRMIGTPLKINKIWVTKKLKKKYKLKKISYCFK